MSSIGETAARFHDACDTGKGWEACSQYCHPDASFTAQADAITTIDTVEAYTEWAKGLALGPLPDSGYELKSLAVDEERGKVSTFAVFKGTHSGDGGPIAPTGKRVETDYVYVMEFDDGRIRHITKIWNDGYALRQLGWG